MCTLSSVQIVSQLVAGVVQFVPTLAHVFLVLGDFLPVFADLFPIPTDFLSAGSVADVSSQFSPIFFQLVTILLQLLPVLLEVLASIADIPPVLPNLTVSGIPAPVIVMRVPMVLMPVRSTGVMLVIIIVGPLPLLVCPCPVAADQQRSAGNLAAERSAIAWRRLVTRRRTRIPNATHTYRRQMTWRNMPVTMVVCYGG